MVVTGTRGDVQLVRDLPAGAVQFIAGDVAVAQAGLHASYPMLGITVELDFWLQPYRVILALADACELRCGDAIRGRSATSAFTPSSPWTAAPRA